MKNLNTDKLVNHVFNLWDNGINHEGIVLENIRSEFGLSENDAESCLRLIKTGLSHAKAISAGNGSKSDIPDNPIVQAALKIGMSKLGQSADQSVQKPWWKFW
jgi:hypothetical protein